MTVDALYLHVPFCRRRCAYCDFVSGPYSAAAEAVYVDGVLHEVDLLAMRHPSVTLNTIYIGGGTPSVISPDAIRHLVTRIGDRWTIATDAEVTLEANPDSVDRARAAVWAQAGVNRVSLGLQVAQDDLLVRLGRLHDVEHFIKATEALDAEGLTHRNVDILFGVPGQTMADVDKAIALVIALAFEHVSFYALSLVPGTPLAARHPTYPDSDDEANLERAMYHHIRERLTAAGYEVYEISNAARPGCRARHNLVYWEARPYFGLGPGAAAYVDGVRSRHAETIGAWRASLDEAQANHRVVLGTVEETIDDDEAANEAMMLGLRLTEGVDLALLSARFGRDLKTRYRARLADLKARDLITIQGDRVALSRHGLDFANEVFRAFV